MERTFDAIFFDLGGTLRLLHKDEAHQARAAERIAQLVGTDMDPQAFLALLNARYETYRKVAFETMWESTEAELWTRYMTPEFPRDRIVQNAVELSFQYRQTTGIRHVAPHGAEAIRTLHARGYKLGIISNLITSQEVPDWLREDGLEQYFSCVLLSAVIGYRKPDPRIYQLACEQIGVPPERCVSVADNLSRDITGARAARIGLNVLYITPEKLEQKRASINDENRPDAVIFDFCELPELFPEAPRAQLAGARRV